MHADLPRLWLVPQSVAVRSQDLVDPDLKDVLGAMHNVVINNAGDSTSLTDVVLVLGVVFMVIVVPVLLSFRHKAMKMQVVSPDDQAASAELWDRARRMETRIEYLERVLDSEMPGWRNRS